MGITDEAVQREQAVEFATFWSRAWAYILDGILLGAFALTFNAINIANFKSFLLYLLVALISISYKPIMECSYGATLGKMLLKLKVTDQNFNPIDFRQSLFRSLILIIPSILYIPIYYFAFSNETLLRSTQIVEFSTGFAAAYPLQAVVGELAFIIVVIDLIVLLTDKTRTRRSLHDRLGKTFVIFDR